MPYFILQRDYMLIGFGHTIKFDTGVKTWVPPLLVSAAAAIGAVDSDGVTHDPLGAPPDEPKLPEVTNEVLFEAFRTFEARSSDPEFREDFGANGAPAVKALVAYLGQDVSADMRTEAWNAYRLEKATT